MVRRWWGKGGGRGRRREEREENREREKVGGRGERGAEEGTVCCDNVATRKL